MEYLKINTAFVVADPEQEKLAAFGVNVAAGYYRFLFYIWRSFVSFKVIPEKTAFQLDLETFETWKYVFQGLLEQAGVYFLF